VSLQVQIAGVVEKITTKLERQYRDDAELLVAGVIVRARNPGGPASTHYIFIPPRTGRRLNCWTRLGAR
jgi:hypothetical protein